MKQLSNLINFLFEASTLKRLKRTGWQILGENEESIAEHTYMVTVVSYVLAIELKANIEKVLLIALFHDFEEARTGDIYRLADKYVKIAKAKAVQDAFGNLPESSKIIKLTSEYEQRKTLEAKIVKDADTLALCIELKQLIEKGNIHAREWLEHNINQLILDKSREIGNKIKKTDSQEWWKKEREFLHKLSKDLR